ncbi:hypothetical protein V8G54_030881 [Vigna mungo]|uniref:Uncharacterized protein n=1 Tax=Vigna mungo TaxID=3915 RepID=A0AAQ3MY01_VIGMU
MVKNLGFYKIEEIKKIETIKRCKTFSKTQGGVREQHHRKQPSWAPPNCSRFREEVDDEQAHVLVRSSQRPSRTKLSGLRWCDGGEDVFVIWVIGGVVLRCEIGGLSGLNLHIYDWVFLHDFGQWWFLQWLREAVTEEMIKLKILGSLCLCDERFQIHSCGVSNGLVTVLFMTGWSSGDF